MQAAAFCGGVFGDRFFNADKASQLSETLSGQNRTIAFGEGGLAQYVVAYPDKDGAILTLPGGFSRQGHITIGGPCGSEARWGTWAARPNMQLLTVSNFSLY